MAGIILVTAVITFILTYILVILREKQKKDGVEKGWFVAGLVAIAVAIATPFLVIGISTSKRFNFEDISTLGSVGDYFGGSTIGLLSIASIFFIIHTISIQREELRATRLEFEIGNSTAKIQQIDNAFFNMLSLNNQITNDIKIIKDENTISGRTALIELREELILKIAVKQYELDYPDEGMSRWSSNKILRRDYITRLLKEENSIGQGDIDKAYEVFHEEYGDFIGHYMRNNYRIVKFIVENVVEEEKEVEEVFSSTKRKPIVGDRKYYFGMLRAQWSTPEFELIFINSLYSSNKKFKDLIVKYDVLDINGIKKTDETEEQKDPFVIKKDLQKFNAFKALIEKR